MTFGRADNPQAIHRMLDKPHDARLLQRGPKALPAMARVRRSGRSGALIISWLFAMMSPGKTQTVEAMDALRRANFQAHFMEICSHGYIGSRASTDQLKEEARKACEKMFAEKVAADGVSLKD